jgi:hypothetical protein
MIFTGILAVKGWLGFVKTKDGNNHTEDFVRFDGTWNHLQYQFGLKLYCSCIYLFAFYSVLLVFVLFLFLSWAWLYHVYRLGHFGIGEFIQNILFGIIKSSLWTVTTWWPISEFVHCFSSFLSMLLFPSILYCWK